ncbi:MAG: hypothetical protein ACSW8D_14635 [Prevotella sp.]
MESTFKKLISLFSFSAKVHLHTLIANGRNIIAVKLCTSILCNQTLYDPLHDDVINGNERVTFYQILREIFRKNRIKLKTTCHM